jgi:hypothetical protein
MPIDISARVLGDKELAQTLERLSGQDIPKAIKAGVRYAARGGRTAIAKNIGANYSLSAARIKQDVSEPSYRDGGQTAIIRTSRKPITFASFKARDVRPKGVTVAIYRGKRSRHPKGFGAKGLFWTRQGADRYPLNVLKGPSIHAIYDGGMFAGAIQSATEQRIEEQLVTGILRSLGGMARGFGKA